MRADHVFDCVAKCYGVQVSGSFIVKLAMLITGFIVQIVVL